MLFILRFEELTYLRINLKFFYIEFYGNLLIFVRMTTKISVIIRATAMKFADNISYYMPQITHILEICHAHLRLRKSQNKPIASVI